MLAEDVSEKSILDSRFAELESKIKEYNASANFEGIKAAYFFARDAHADQFRYNGDPYMLHPLETAHILADWKLDSSSIIAGLLHDVLEDCNVPYEKIEQDFGKEVADLVDGVTKVAKLRLRGSKESVFVENLRKMFLHMAHDLRVVFVKLADRTHNMRTLDAVPLAKQKRIAQETLDVYAPLAERLGMGKAKGELEDLSFPFVYPEAHEKLLTESVDHYAHVQECLDDMKASLVRELESEGITAKIHGRKKHLYSLWKKLERPEIAWEFGKILDIVALRIMVEDITECYIALGVVHKLYKPFPAKGVSDFIAQPKPNGYRSIHTKVFSEDGRIVEVQIRTHEMHEQAESGAAAHWAYSEAKTKGADGEQLTQGVKADAKLSWVKQLVDWQKEIVDTDEFMEALKFDALNKRNFVFSPKGDIFDLPQGATPVDFAFTVHTNLGNSIMGAKVNGRMVPLDYKLKSGQVVEILRSKKAVGPNRTWLDFVVTSLARKEINKSLKKSYERK